MKEKECLIAVAVALVISSLIAMHITRGGGASENMEIDRYCYELEHDGQIYIVNIKGGIVKK